MFEEAPELLVQKLQEAALAAITPYDFIWSAVLSHKVPDDSVVIIPESWGTPN